MIDDAEGELGNGDGPSERGAEGGEAEQQRSEQAGHLRGVLLPAQPTLRPRARRALHHLSPPSPGGPSPSAPARTAHAGSALGEFSDRL